jgi:hypothetical protein
MNDDKFGEGVVAGFFFMAILALAALAGIAIEQWLITSDCKDFGKTNVRTTWYECRPIEQKK